MNYMDIISKFAQENNFALTSLEVKNIPSYQISHENLLPLLRFVKEHEELRFTLLTDLFAADFPEREKRFEVVYSLLSLKLNQRLIFKIQIDDGELAPSITSIHNSACWYEREAFDMFGIEFEGAQDLRRILTDYGFSGHPLRKDFPVTGHVQVKYDEQLEKVVYEPVLLEQEFRNFDFSSPWQGPGDYKLPGDEKAK